MPYVNIKVTKENGEPTVAQKEELIKGMTELLHTVLGRNRASTVVIIDEIETENYGLGGESIKIKRKRKEKR
ncbi:4-oxalocrotonate tautomerase family protein [Campylobacter fetus]|nr:4-oxalocrotonate tautomerase family protein [Campylobacter fetus]EAI5944925.1 4-oxalocrotonate tautomerase family protein [Campylobacter fetus]EAJ0319574.1 4-oxalocrotonate tautomerase family protein [Campylobacter fetus]EAJ0345635.1 4-oxalocrotonate tautomerase family protein [Campylobacter fetus]EAJ1239167.1 4-oxalocrotonate tautomerase family protein [Campylobacter fetus]